MPTHIPKLLLKDGDFPENIYRMCNYNVIEHAFKWDPITRSNSDILFGKHTLREYILSQAQNRDRNRVASILKGKDAPLKSEYMKNYQQELEKRWVDEHMKSIMMEIQEKHIHIMCKDFIESPDTINVVQDIIRELLDILAEDAYRQLISLPAMPSRFVKWPSKYLQGGPLDQQPDTIQRLIAWKFGVPHTPKEISALPINPPDTIDTYLQKYPRHDTMTRILKSIEII